MSGKSSEADNRGTDVYLVRYKISGRLAESEASHRQLLEVNREFGLNWIRSYESDDGREIFCVYQAPDATALKDQALCLGLQIVDLFHVRESIPPGRRLREDRNY